MKLFSKEDLTANGAKTVKVGIDKETNEAERRSTMLDSAVVKNYEKEQAALVDIIKELGLEQELNEAIDNNKDMNETDVIREFANSLSERLDTEYKVGTLEELYNEDREDSAKITKGEDGKYYDKNKNEIDVSLIRQAVQLQPDDPSLRFSVKGEKDADGEFKTVFIGEKKDEKGEWQDDKVIYSEKNSEFAKASEDVEIASNIKAGIGLGLSKYLEDKSNVDKNEKVDFGRVEAEKAGTKQDSATMTKSDADRFKTALDEFNTKYIEVKKGAEELDRAIEKSDKYSSLSSKNVFKAFADRDVMVRCYKLHIPYKDAYVTKTDLFLSSVRAVTSTNIFESLLEVALTKIVDKMSLEEKAQYQKDGIIEKEDAQNLVEAAPPEEVTTPVSEDETKQDSDSAEKAESSNEDKPKSNAVSVDKPEEKPKDDLSKDTDKKEISFEIKDVTIDKDTLVKGEYDKESKSFKDVFKSNGDRYQTIRDSQINEFGVDISKNSVGFRRTDEKGDNRLFAVSSDNRMISKIEVSVKDNSFLNSVTREGTKYAPGAFVVREEKGTYLCDMSMKVRATLEGEPRPYASKIDVDTKEMDFTGKFISDVDRSLGKNNFDNEKQVDAAFEKAVDKMYDTCRNNVEQERADLMQKRDDIDKKINSIENLPDESKDKKTEKLVSDLKEARNDIEKKLNDIEKADKTSVDEKISYIKNFKEDNYEVKIDKDIQDKIDKQIDSDIEKRINGDDVDDRIAALKEKYDSEANKIDKNEQLSADEKSIAKENLKTEINSHIEKNETFKADKADLETVKSSNDKVEVESALERFADRHKDDKEKPAELVEAVKDYALLDIKNADTFSDFKDKVDNAIKTYEGTCEHYGIELKDNYKSEIFDVAKEKIDSSTMSDTAKENLISKLGSPVEQTPAQEPMEKLIENDKNNDLPECKSELGKEISEAILSDDKSELQSIIVEGKLDSLELNDEDKSILVKTANGTSVDNDKLNEAISRIDEAASKLETESTQVDIEPVEIPDFDFDPMSAVGAEEIDNNYPDAAEEQVLGYEDFSEDSIFSQQENVSEEDLSSVIISEENLQESPDYIEIINSQESGNSFDEKATSYLAENYSEFSDNDVVEFTKAVSYELRSPAQAVDIVDKALIKNGINPIKRAEIFRSVADSIEKNVSDYLPEIDRKENDEIYVRIGNVETSVAVNNEANVGEAVRPIIDACCGAFVKNEELSEKLASAIEKTDFGDKPEDMLQNILAQLIAPVSMDYLKGDIDSAERRIEDFISPSEIIEMPEDDAKDVEAESPTENNEAYTEVEDEDFDDFDDFLS